MKYLLRLWLLLAAAAPLLAQTGLQDSLREMNRKIDVLTEEIERMKLGDVSEPDLQPQRGLGPAAAKVYGLKKTGVSIAGYGEIVYENYSKKLDNRTASTTSNQLDYLRNVVYFGYRFNDWILFNSEVEFEHGSTGKGGEVSVEFGYVELMLSPHFNIRAGMVLPPVGIINEKHEPSSFFGTLRPQVEQRIIPSTWRTNGIGAYGEIIPNLQYRAYVVEGLDASKFSDNDGLRGGRQSGARAKAEKLALTGKLEYVGLPGTVLGASFYTGNSNQSLDDTVDVSTTVVSVHGELSWKGLEARALWARNTVGHAAWVSAVAGKTVGSAMDGWYGVIGYDVMPWIAPGSVHYLAPFIQYESFNTHAEVPSGMVRNKAWDRHIFTAGITYKPHPNVAFKADYRNNDNEAGTGNDQWNLAVNYLF
jgi:hypothetical protein